MRILLSIPLAAAVLASCASSRTIHTEHPGGGGLWTYETVGGVANGSSKTYYPEGGLHSTGTYSAGKKHGLFVFYRRDRTVYKKAYFWKGYRMWETEDPVAEPPPELQAEIDRREEQHRIIRGDIWDTGPPDPHFPSLTRISPKNRVGLQIGAGGFASDDYDSERGTLFANHRFRRVGLLVQADASRIRSIDDSFAGRSTLEVAGAYFLDAAGGTLAPSLGVALPISDNTGRGQEVAAASSTQRPGDTAKAIASRAALRSGLVFSRAGRFWRAQVDAGLDLAIGAESSALQPYGRLGAGFSLGQRSLAWTVEATRVSRLDETSLSTRSIGTGFTGFLRGVWMSPLFSLSDQGHLLFQLGVGIDH